MMNEASLIMESLTGGADGPTSVFVALPKELEMIILIAALVIGVVFCLFGQKIIRVIGVVTGLLTGAVLGTVAAVVFGLSGGAFVGCVAGTGLLLAILFGIFRKAGVFWSVLVLSAEIVSGIRPADFTILFPDDFDCRIGSWFASCNFGREAGRACCSICYGNKRRLDDRKCSFLVHSRKDRTADLGDHCFAGSARHGGSVYDAFQEDGKKRKDPF